MLARPPVASVSPAPGAPSRCVDGPLPTAAPHLPWNRLLHHSTTSLRCGMVRRLPPTLTRPLQVSPSVPQRPGCHTLLPLPHPFIVPGDRFRECYK